MYIKSTNWLFQTKSIKLKIVTFKLRVFKNNIFLKNHKIATLLS